MSQRSIGLDDPFGYLLVQQSDDSKSTVKLFNRSRTHVCRMAPRNIDIRAVNEDVTSQECVRGIARGSRDATSAREKI